MSSVVQNLYQRLREQVISLTVDVDDKEHVCAILERKVAHERSLLSRVEDDCNEENQIRFEVMNIKFMLTIFSPLTCHIFFHAFFSV